MDFDEFDTEIRKARAGVLVFGCLSLILTALTTAGLFVFAFLILHHFGIL